MLSKIDLEPAESNTACKQIQPLSSVVVVVVVVVVVAAAVAAAAAAAAATVETVVRASCVQDR